MMLLSSPSEANPEKFKNKSFHRKVCYIQCSKAKEQNFQFWKLLAAELDTHIKYVYTCYASPKLIKCHVMSPHQYGCQHSEKVFSIV